MPGGYFNRKRALDYIRSNGTDIEAARIERILNGVKPPPAVVRSITGAQNEDGGFPYRGTGGHPSTLSDTSYRLVWLDDLGLLHSAAGRRAVGFIASSQKPDGSWDENPAVNSYNPPPWMKPGKTASVVFNTANSLFWLLMAGRPEGVRQGLWFLARHQTSPGAFAGFRHNTWLAVSVIGMVEGWQAPGVQQGLDFLAGIPAGEWVASQISWMLWTFLKCGMPGGSAPVGRMLEELLQRQAADGGFPAEDGPAFAVNATIEALKVVRLYERCLDLSPRDYGKE